MDSKMSLADKAISLRNEYSDIKRSIIQYQKRYEELWEPAKEGISIDNDVICSTVKRILSLYQEGDMEGIKNIGQEYIWIFLVHNFGISDRPELKETEIIAYDIAKLTEINPLHLRMLALIVKNMPLYKKCMEVKFDKTTESVFFETALETNAFDYAKLLYGRIDLCEYRTAEGESLLHLIVRKLSYEEIEAIIQDIDDIYLPDKDGVTPLHIAVRAFNDVVIETLIEHSLPDESKISYIEYFISNFQKNYSDFMYERMISLLVTLGLRKNIKPELLETLSPAKKEITLKLLNIAS
jgi:hypothetical protein